MKQPDSLNTLYPKPLELEKDELTYLFTKDPALLEDFLATRRAVYASKDVTQKSLKTGETWNYGLDTNVLTVLNKNGKCIGGAIVVINHCDKADNLLPLESENFKLRNAFPEYHLESTPHAAFKSLFIEPDYADWLCSANIFRCIYNLCISNRVNFLFGTAPPATARRNKVALNKLKLGLSAEIKEDIQLPYEERWNGFQRHLLVVDISKHYANATVSRKRVEELV